ncbi:MAG TPA: Stp1/IreP family PP2C-type Ser/Thr phosphatase [Acidimicrobiales bacterium]
MTRFAWGAATDTGRVRQANEDAVLAVDGLYAVADGMGGHNAGEVASHLAIETLQDEFTAAGTDVLVEAVQTANRVLVERSASDTELSGMGTTMCALALVDADGRDAIAVVNVGDSRLYLLSDGELTQITEDHSLVATLERQGRISSAEAAVHPQRNILTRALGIDASVMVDSWEILPVIGDRYVLCSDGLFNEVEDSRLAATLRRLADPDEAARELVRLANEAGGRDNISCVVVDVVDGAGAEALAADAPAAAATSSRVTASRTGGDAELFTPPPESAPSGSPVDDDSPPSSTSRRKRRGGRGAHAADDRPRRRLLTWRVGLFFLAFLAIIGIGLGIIVWAGNNTYYVGLSGDEVVIFRGRPGGVLWIDPEVETTTGIAEQDVPAASIDAVRSGVEEPSLSAAQRYVDNLRDQIADATTTTTTSTTTTVPATPPAPEAPPA